MSTTLDFDTNPLLLEQGDLDELVVTVDEGGSCIDINGLCPRCRHFVHFVIPVREFSPDAGSAAAASVTAPANSGDMDVADLYVTHEHEPHVRKRRRDERSVALHCNCATTHLDPHSHKPVAGGCGAWFSVTLAAHPHRKHPHLYPGPPLSLYEENNAVARDKLAENELMRVRSAAAGWKTGLAALVALIPTLVVVKGTDTVDKLGRSDAIVVGVLVAAGAVAAVVATLLALRAANGPLKQWKIVSDDLRPGREREVAATIDYLRCARQATILAATLLAAAIAYAWAAPTPPAPAYLSVGLPGGTVVCGKLVSSDPGSVRVQRADGETIAFALADVKSTTFVSSC